MRIDARVDNRPRTPSSVGFVYVSNREGAKNSGGKRAGRLPAQVNTGNRRRGRLLVLGECTHRLVISGISLVRYLSGQTQRHQWRK